MNVVGSVDPCLYSEHGGLNETYVLTTIDGKNIAAINYETIDLKYLASREKNAKRRRLMLTPDFSAFKTKIVIRADNKDLAKPFFYDGLKQYNAMGGERQDVKKGAPGSPSPVEQSFFSKYWMYIIGAMFILPRLLGEEPPAPAGQTAPTRAAGAR
jgi:hypothetical protein